VPSLDEEARHILALARGDAQRAFDHVERQHGVIVLRTQVLLSLCGIVITVTGFSGRTIAITGPLARAAIVAGLLTVLAAALVAVTGVLKLAWLTQHIRTATTGGGGRTEAGELTVDALATVRSCLEQRDVKTRRLRLAMILFGAGFALYCVAIAQMLALAR
jgi:hypothetical protein